MLRNCCGKALARAETLSGGGKIENRSYLSNQYWMIRKNDSNWLSTIQACPQPLQHSIAGRIALKRCPQLQSQFNLEPILSILATFLSDHSLKTESNRRDTVLMMLGDELRKARERAGLTQEELAVRAKIHRTYVSLLERDLKSPTLDVLFRVCNAMEIRPSRLIARLEKARENR